MIVFDLDDTLYKEIDFLKSAYREIAERFRISCHDMLDGYLQGQDVFQDVIDHFGLDVDKAALLSIYRHHRPQIILDDDTRSALRSLKSRGVRMGLMTDGRSITQRNKIEVLGLLDDLEPDDILISEEFGYSKPQHEVYEYFEQRYPDEQFIYVGDNVMKDFVTANQRGWKTIALLDDGRNIHPQLFDQYPAAYQPQLKISKLSCLNSLSLCLATR